VQTAFDNARMIGVALRVYEAVQCPIDVTAVIFREESAPLNLAETLSARVPRLIAQHAQLGRDVSRSLVISWLQVTGVSRVELVAPGDDLTIPPDGYATPGNIALTDGGLAW
jgi:phage-related baseplate assembly protein